MLNCKKAFQTHEKCKNSDDINVHLIVYLQNIRSLRNKISELLISLSDIEPHVLCFMEHHLKDCELSNTHIPNFKLGANYCRSTLK